MSDMAESTGNLVANGEFMNDNEHNFLYGNSATDFFNSDLAKEFDLNGMSDQEILQTAVEEATYQKKYKEWMDSQVAGRDRAREVMENGEFEMAGGVGKLDKMNDLAWGEAVLGVANMFHKDVVKLTKVQKENMFRRSVNSTIAILLHEFVTGTGEEGREFGPEHALTNKIKDHNAVQEALHEFYLKNRHKSTEDKLSSVENYGYEFSPNSKYDELFNIPTSAIEHFEMVKEIINDKECSMLFLGGVTVNVIPKNIKELNIIVENSTSKTSLMLHIPDNIERNGKEVPFGTTRQEFRFTVPLDRNRLITEYDNSVINRIRNYINNTYENLINGTLR